MCTSAHLIKGTPSGPDDIKLTDQLRPCMGQDVFHHTLPWRVAVPSKEFLKTESFKHPKRKKSKGMIPREYGTRRMIHHPVFTSWVASASRCLKMKEIKLKKSINRKQKYIYINLKFCYKHDWISGMHSLSQPSIQQRLWWQKSKI